MKLLTVDKFKEMKNRSHLAIIGSGYSLNDVSEEKWALICDEYDTFGMNWSCKFFLPYTWYLVREQAATPKRIGPGQTLSDFIEDMADVPTTLIVKDMSYRTDNYIHARHTELFDHPGRVFKEITGKCSAKAFSDNIFEQGIHHGKNTMTDAMHFAVAMGYKEILFVGVDLYDSRYFWLPYDEPSPMVKNEGRTCESPHLAAENIVKIVTDTAATWDIKMAVENPKSLLAKHIPVWSAE